MGDGSFFGDRVPLQVSWRPITWFIVVVNALFPLWVLHGLSLSNRPTCTPETVVLCVDRVTGVASSTLVPSLLLWLLADVLLLIVWLVTRQRSAG